jgi:hypothetical protein
VKNSLVDIIIINLMTFSSREVITYFTDSDYFDSKGQKRLSWDLPNNGKILGLEKEGKTAKNY